LKTTQIPNLIKIRPMAAELFRADRQTDGQNDGLETITVAFVVFRKCLKTKDKSAGNKKEPKNTEGTGTVKQVTLKSTQHKSTKNHDSVFHSIPSV
jgi:hypothetical protein